MLKDDPKTQTKKGQRNTNKPETVGKVYDKNDLLLGEIWMWTKTKRFSFVWKTGGKKGLESDTLKGLSNQLRKSVKFMYIRYKRTKTFNVTDFYKLSIDKKLHWRSEEFYGSEHKRK